MRWLRPLSNRIFVASALLAVACIVAALWLINRTVTAQAERAVDRGLVEAAALVTEYRRLTLVQLSQAAHLLADLPKLKAAVALDDPPTLAPLAADYRRQLAADVLLVTGRAGRLLAQQGLSPPEAAALPQVAGAPWVVGRARIRFLPRDDGLLLLVTVPIWIDVAAPDLLGTLSVGRAMDAGFAAQIARFTNSEVVFAWAGDVRAATLPPEVARTIASARGEVGPGLVRLGDEEFAVIRRPVDADLGVSPFDALGLDPWPAGGASPGEVIVARSRSEQLQPLRALHTALGVIALAAVLAATLLSYFVSRSVTRPLRAITAAMRDVAASGDLAASRPLAPGGRWDDEDAQVLASAFGAMTASLARFQREAAQRERLSTLGRLSTVVAHEIRNPLMIIKAALRSLRRDDSSEADARAAVTDIDEEVARLNRLVNQVLDFARPIRFTMAPASLGAIVADAVRAVAADGLEVPTRLQVDPAADALVTDAERLRQALINILANARQATAAAADAPVLVRADALDGETLRLTVRDHGPGLDETTLARIFEPFFTTKPTGTGIGLAVTRNIVEGLGGTVQVTSAKGDGTTVVVDLPRHATPPAPHTP